MILNIWINKSCQNTKNIFFLAMYLTSFFFKMIFKISNVHYDLNFAPKCFKKIFFELHFLFFKFWRKVDCSNLIRTKVMAKNSKITILGPRAPRMDIGVWKFILRSNFWLPFEWYGSFLISLWGHFWLSYSAIPFYT